jgi:hypothetical protein
LTACGEPIPVTPQDKNPLKEINNQDLSIKIYEDPNWERSGIKHVYVKVNSENVLYVLVPSYRSVDVIYPGKDLKDFREISNNSYIRYILKDGTLNEIN